MTADIIPLKTDRPDPREVIARHMSNTVEPSPQSKLRASKLIDALLDAGWEIVRRGERRE
jgi:hypothetical protein